MSNIKDAYEFLRKSKVYFLATVDVDQPKLRPFGTIAIFEGKLYIQTAKSKEVSKQIQQNSKVEISAFSEGEWIRITGKLVRDDRIEAKTYMLEEYPNLKNRYSAEDDNTEVLYFKDAIVGLYGIDGLKEEYIL